MANTSATELLRRCLEGETWTGDLLQSALAEDSGRAFFRVVVEGLGDRFEPRLCDEYARLFSRVIELVRPDLTAADLVARYERVREPKVCRQDPKNIYVLSRVTLGADVAVTSIVLDAAKQRFPAAQIYFVGPAKNWELFAADQRILLLPFSYPRAGSIEERLSDWPSLTDGIVIDPDSRLSQLGLLPVCEEKDYFFFESRAYGGTSDATLVKLTQQWVKRTFQVDAKAWLAPRPSALTARSAPLRSRLGTDTEPRASASGRTKSPGHDSSFLAADIAVSFGVGENVEKRVADPFEEELLRALVATGGSVLIDEGAGGEETERVRRLCARFPQVTAWNGAYAPFADAIRNAKLYIGYDSAGQHVAAASGTRLLSIFAGYSVERMFQRWRPDGDGRIDVVKVIDRHPAQVLQAALQNLTL